MKRTVAVFSLCVVAVSLLSAQHAPWEKMAGPPGLDVSVIYKTNNVVFAGTESQGIYRSADNGTTWVAANAGIELTAIQDLIASGGNLLAGVAGRSFACPESNNVFKSTDNGATWTPTSGLSGKIVHSFVIKDGTIWATFDALPNESGIARSTDNGNTWMVVPSIITDGGEAIVSDDAIIVAEDNFIWRSLDDGDSWDLVEQFNFNGVSSFARAGTRLFAASGTGMLTSDDNGGTWKFSAFEGGVGSFSSDGNIIYLGSSSKVFKSTNQGGTWTDVSTGLDLYWYSVR